MGGNVVSNLCSLPATDLNFTSELNRATAYQISLDYFYRKRMVHGV